MAAFLQALAQQDQHAICPEPEQEAFVANYDSHA
jgi:hypothetical protein